MARPTAPDHDDKAAAVLAAAGQVFAQRGYEGATMLDVAQAAGFSKAGVYHYFASKEHLLHGLLRGSLQEVVDDLVSADPGDDAEPAGRLAALVDAYVRSFSTRLRVVTPLLLRLDLLRPEWRAEVKGLERQIVDRFADAAGALGHPDLAPDGRLPGARGGELDLLLVRPRWRPEHRGPRPRRGRHLHRSADQNP